MDELILTHFADEPEKFLGSVVPPVFMNSIHVFDTIEDHAAVDIDRRDDFVYGRVSNPTTRILEDKVAALERAERALFFSSGMAAISCAILSHCKAGDHLICLKNIYSCVRGFIDQCLVPRFGMSVTYVSGDPDKIESAIRPETSLILLESPCSNLFFVCDLREIAKIAKKHGIRTMIDNTYCTPLFQKPLELGIDMVAHTATKYLGGHSDCMGGVLASNDREWMDRIFHVERQYIGSVIGPMEAWLIIRGMRTLRVRLEQHSRTAMAAARFLENHERVKRVFYPALPSSPQYELMKTQQSGSCGLLSFTLNGSCSDAQKVADRLKHFSKGVSWGGFESLVSMPYRTLSSEQAAWYGEGAEPGLIRLHLGLEGEQTLLDDLVQALEG